MSKKSEENKKGKIRVMAVGRKRRENKGNVLRAALLFLAFLFGGNIFFNSSYFLFLSGVAEAQEAVPAVTAVPQATAALPATVAPQATLPGIPTESMSDYPAVGFDAGVWNDGQAAIWDLHILDHYRYFGPPQRAKGYKPEQPINFSHIVHVQQNKMECQYCHWNVAKSSYAAIPDVESCMGCHKLVAGHDEQSKAEIQKLQKYYTENKPIEWLKVHVMPDHYKFNHKRHVKGGVACHECHGQIPEMPKVERVSSMKMGWCLDCHRQRGASIDCATCHY
jgi:hypothetical protein